jgi:hypothetical protein
MSRSTDGGLTWSASTVPSDSVIGGQPVVQPSGKVVVPISNGFGGSLMSYVSANGGVSFTGPFSIATIFAHGVAGGLRDGEGLSSAEVDAAGRIYVVWHDCRFRSGCSANDIVMSTSTDGQSWTAVTRLPIAPVGSTVDAFIPGIGVDRATSGATAHLAVSFYLYPQTSCSVSTCKLYGGLISSTNGGATWSTTAVLLGPIKMRWLPLTTQGYMVGDYVSTSIVGGSAYPVLMNAARGGCQVGQVTSCHEAAVVPTGGLSVVGGNHPAERPATVGQSAAPRRQEMRTAF